jgi:hypothetical protein
VELIVAQDAPTETAHLITKQENNLPSQATYRWPDSSLCHEAYQKHNQENHYANFGSHKHRSNQQDTILYFSSVHVVVAQF